MVRMVCSEEEEEAEEEEKEEEEDQKEVRTPHKDVGNHECYNF